MDLLDGIDDISYNQQNYVKNIEDQLESEVEHDTQINEAGSESDDNDGTESSENAPIIAENLPGVSDIASRLDKIKNRIQGKDKLASEGVKEDGNEDNVAGTVDKDLDATQAIQNLLDFNFDMSNSILNNTSEKSANALGFTFDIQSSNLLGQEVQKLPQLALDLDDFNNDTQAINTQIINTTTQMDQSTQMIDNSTQVIGKETQVIEHGRQPEKETQPLESLFMNSDDEDEPIAIPLSKEQRQEKIAKLAELKKQERLQREIQLEQDISKTSLTDEENDLNDEHNDTVVSNINPTDKTSMKELEQAEEFINIQKRHRDIRPEFVKKNLFTKHRLISAFDSDDDDKENHQDNVMDNKEKVTSTPTTSPVRLVEKEPVLNMDDSSSDDGEELNVLDLINAKPKPSIKTGGTKNTFQAYAQRIKQSMNKDTNQFMLDGSDSESDLEIEVGTNTSKFSNDGRELRKIPELLKEQRLVLQQKFLKKNFFNKSKAGNVPNAVKSLMITGSANESHTKSIEFQGFLSNLKKSNIQQLQANRLSNPDNAILQEMEKDEEVMGSLLEREIERARKIRKQEKLREKAKLALLGRGDTVVSDMDEVPDSDFEVQESDFQSGTGSDDNSDHDEDENVDKDKNADSTKEANAKSEALRNDDTYMFESRNSDSDGVGIEEEGIVASSHDEESVTKNDASMDERLNITEAKIELFTNLQPRVEKAPTQDLLFGIENGDSMQNWKLPELSFDDINESVTQQDEPTQADGSTPVDQGENPNDDDEDDLITPTAVQNGRKKIRLNRLEKLPEEVEDEEFAMKEKIKQYEAKIRKKELALRKRRRELEKRGVKNVVEGEAVESEDEWRGLGGMEGELSEEANSEDEKMIDNDFNIDLKNDEIRKKFMEEYQIKDQKQLEKLLDDIKNHRLTKRAAANGLDIEFSDEEDELLMAYRRQKKAEQLQKLLESKGLQDSLKNDKQKAFFECMEEKASAIVIDDEDDEEAEIDDNISANEDDLESEAPPKKRFKIEESFVQKQLSFLMESRDDNYSQIQRKSRMQHGLNSSDEEMEDLQQLKNKSLASLTSLGTKRSESPIEVSNENTSEPTVVTAETDADDDNEDNDTLMPSFKKPSMVKSFKLLNENQKHGISEGKHFSGVTVNKLYKVALGSSASISYLSRNKSQRVAVKTAKEQRLERHLSLSKKNRSRVFTSSGFE